MSQSLFKNPEVSTLPSLVGTGNGTLTVDRLTHFTITQTYQAICTAVAPFTVFNIIGSVDGALGVAQVGTQYNDDDLKIFLTINQGPTLFAIGDTFTFGVTQGTDLTEENINLYDELPQKNFSTGIAGTNAGDDNLRHNPVALVAKMTLGDLEFTAVPANEAGNRILVEYYDTAVAQKASLTIQDLTFEADSPGVTGNGITIEYEDWTPAELAEGTIQDLIAFANTAGSAGNTIQINYTTGGTAGSELVSVLSTVITVQIESGVSTAQQIRDAIMAFPAAAALVTVFRTGTGTELQTAPASVTLSGGADAIGQAGSEVVSVLGSAIKVKFQSGVSLASQIKAAVDGLPAAAALVDVLISGTGTNAQSAPVSITNLSGGQNASGTPGNEIVTVSGQRINVGFQNGINTAADIKAKLDATPAVMALLSVTIVGVGTNPQTAPAQRFLSRGSRSDTFFLNVNELSAPASFHDGNGSLSINSIVVHDDIWARGDADFNGVVSLDDIFASENDSGDPVPNLQKALKEINSNGKVIFHTENHSKLVWQSPSLSFSENLVIRFPDTGFYNRVLSTASPLSLNDGESLWVTVNRSANVNLSANISVQVPNGSNNIRLATRVGTNLILFDGTMLKNGSSAHIGEALDVFAQVFTLFTSSGRWIYDPSIAGKISWDSALRFSPLGSSNEVTVYPDDLILADGEVAYVEFSDPFVTEVKTLSIASRNNPVTANPNNYWVLYRKGSKIFTRHGAELKPGEETEVGESVSEDIFTYIGSDGETDSSPDYTNATGTPITNKSLADGDNLTKSIKKLDIYAKEIQDELRAYFASLRLDAHPTNPNRVIITGADVTLSDNSIIAQLLDQRMLSFSGAVIDFSTGTVYAPNEVTILGTNFTPGTLGLNHYFWYAVGLTIDLGLANNQVSAKVLVEPGAFSHASLASASVPDNTSDRPVGYVFVQDNSGSGLQPITVANFRRLQGGVGSGGGGGGGGGFRVVPETPTGLVNGSNTFFYLSEAPNNADDVVLFDDGALVDQSQYTILGNQITMGYAPAAGHSIYVYMFFTVSPDFIQEVPSGLINGTNDTFTLSSPCLDSNALIVWIDGLVIPANQRTVVGTTLTFAPSAIPNVGQSVAVFYSTTAVGGGGGGSGVAHTQYFTLSAGDITAKQVTLADTPATASTTMLDIIKGSSQEYGTDFVVSGNILSWNGLQLQSELVAGDKLRVHYYT